MNGTEVMRLPQGTEGLGPALAVDFGCEVRIKFFSASEAKLKTRTNIIPSQPKQLTDVWRACQKPG